MDIEALNCRCCGGILKVNSNLCVCEYCGATNFISDVANKYINQLNRANKLRQEREFDNAARIYDNILAENIPTSDILWYRTLCEYGIEYVPDPISEKYIPTMHRVNEESILTYHSYLDALSAASREQKETLEKEAEYINKIQTDYLNIAKNEKPYDVFICYKETDESTGEKTDDVAIADELYSKLINRGFKVFFARVTLKSKLSVDYEPYIFAALKSSRAMVVLGTKAEYFMSVWVKNEWGRFLKLMQDDPNKQMFFACDDPEELPRAFATKQAALLGEEGSLENLAENIERFLKNKAPKRKVQELNKDESYEHALALVRTREHFRAINVIEEYIKKYPEDASGYWLRMLNRLKSTPGTIKRMKVNLYADADYSKAIKYATEDQKIEYIETAKTCSKNLNEQKNFDCLLENESIKYVNNFTANTESGAKTFEVRDKVREYAKSAERCNNFLRYTFTLGMILYFLGNLIAIMILGNGAGKWVPASVIITAPMIVLGVAILLSYNILLDIIVSFVVLVFTIISAFNTPVSDFFRVVASILPAIAYIATSNSFYLNKVRNKMLHHTVNMNNTLEALRVETEKASSDLSLFASKLLKEFKKNNDIDDNVIEIHDDDYFIAQKKIQGIYESEVTKQEPLMNLTIPNDMSKRTVRTESGVGVIALILSCIPVLDIAGLGCALYDIFTDKYKKYTHITAVASLVVDMIVVIAGYIIYLNL
ncbi:MAG: TIR domain-containing protein [Lachnospiraceae bacterium]|nr:TIR domain-containing protein [Lachnospiraceae bacterium]